MNVTNSETRSEKLQNGPMKMKESKARIAFLILNTTFLSIFALLCLLPFFNMLAISLSSREAVDADIVSLFPVGFT